MTASLSGKISVASVKSLKPGEELRDTELKGFGCRCQERAASYFVLTRVRGRLSRITIGRHGSPWTPETARREAARILLAVRNGDDPRRQRREEKELGLSFAEVGQRFLDEHGPKLKASTRDVYGSMMRTHLNPRLGKLEISRIGVVDVSKAHASWSATPRGANHALSLLSKVLNWAENQGWREEGSNPCRKVKRYKETKRERYLSGAELARLGQALERAEEDQTANPYIVAAIRLLILTGARLSEILTLRWEYVDLERRRLRLPDSKTGAKAIVLNRAAMEVLQRLDRIDGNPWVLPGHVRGSHLVNLQKPWRSLRTAAGFDDVRLHDLRHSYASVAVEAGGSLPVIGNLLGHRNAQTTARYAHVANDVADRLAEAAGARITSFWSGPAVAEKPLDLPSPASEDGNEPDKN
ncbi:MAG: tyrosine-type recombinase/integrase [Hyphomicrobiaceae bacterium]